MAKSLVIVESPAKAKTINKFLGSEYIVKSSVGHLKDLPKSRLGVDVEDAFKPEYITIKGKGRIISELKRVARGVERVYLASDPDREGEAIAWHIAEELNGQGDRIFRVLFNEITERAVLEAVNKPGRLNKDRFYAQQARRILDRLVGYKISPLLWKNVRKGLSAGRVQSVAVRLVCDREKDIKEFVKEEYWSILAKFRADGRESLFDAKLARRNGKKVKIKNSDESKTILKDLKHAGYKVTGIKHKKRIRRPAPPFITSKLQQEAARRLGFPARKTMLIAQQLYEGVELGDKGSVGLITYMRTDSPRVSSEAVKDARSFILSHYGDEYVPAKPNIYSGKRGAQGAHEAIRPTNIAYSPAFLKSFLRSDQFNLYILIWERFVASQMTSARIGQTTIDIEARVDIDSTPVYVFTAAGSVMEFDGFTRVYQQSDKKEDELKIPVLDLGEHMELDNIEPVQHFTQPPPRFNEASLVKELEENGIGRPSTYAAILSTIQDRGYVIKNKGQFVPEKLGLEVTGLLVKSFPKILDVKFTAHLEEELDMIEDGRIDWCKVVSEFYVPFRKFLEKAELEMEDIKKREEPTKIECDKCGSLMLKKWGRRGEFLSCSSYPECKNTREFVEADDGSIQVVELEVREEECSKCGKPMMVREGRFGRFLSCSDYPDCKTVMSFPTGVGCPVKDCGGNLVERRSRKGKDFFGCSRYPDCTYALWDRPISESCPECSYPIMIKKRKRDGSTVKCCAEKACRYKDMS